MVVDTSALLALYLGERTAPWVAEQLATHRGELHVSTVNLTETLIHLQDRLASGFERARASLYSSGLDFHPPDRRQAELAARARLKYPLNLGDCFAYALAVVLDAPILTLAADFRATDRPVLMP